MSQVPKVDKVSLIVRQGMYDFVTLVETWMQNHIHDSVFATDGYDKKANMVILKIQLSFLC